VNTTSSKVQRYPRALFIILSVGLMVRMAFVLGYTRPLISDEREYDNLAVSLASNGAYTVNGMPTAYRPVGYPMFVGLVYLVRGHDPITVKCIQAVIDTATAFLIFLLLTGYSDRVRVTAAGIWVLFVPAVLYTNFLMTETLSTFLLLATVLLLTQDWQANFYRFIIIGALFGLLVLMKPGLLLFLIALPFFSKNLGTHPRNFAFVGLAVFLVVAPWVLRNYSKFGEISPSSNGGINLLIGNNPHTTGAYGITFDPVILQDARNEFEADRKAFRYAAGYIVQNPVAFAVNAVKKLGRLFESEGGLLVWSFHRAPEDFSSRYASKYASISLALVLLTNLPYFAIMLAGLFGYLAAQKDKLWWLSTILFASWILLHIIFFGGGRFHFPLMPLFVVFASIFLTNIGDTFASLSSAQRTTGIAISIVLIALWTIEGISVYSA
jgi:hypothetical protein